MVTTNSVEESKALTKKILNSDEVLFTTLNYANKIDDNKIAVCIACSGKEKQWGAENYVKLINFLISKNYKNFLIISGKNQEVLENQIIDRFDKNLNFIKTSSKSIGEVLPDLKQCKLFIGNDTGFFHLAVALGKKSFVILGDCPPHTYSDLIINIDCEIPRSHNSIKSIDYQKVINIFNKATPLSYV